MEEFHVSFGDDVGDVNSQVNMNMEPPTSATSARTSGRQWRRHSKRSKTTWRREVGGRKRSTIIALTSNVVITENLDGAETTDVLDRTGETPHTTGLSVGGPSSNHILLQTMRLRQPHRRCSTDSSTRRPMSASANSDSV